MTWLSRKCCVEAYGTASTYFGRRELVAFYCRIHGKVEVRGQAEADRNYAANEARGSVHVGGLLDVPGGES